MILRTEFDRKADAVYVYFSDKPVAYTKKLDDMRYYLGATNYFLYNHSQTMALPGATLESGMDSPVIKSDGSIELFIRCRDKNGNENVDEFAVSFCVEPSPDTTPPLIVGSSLEDGAPLKAGVDNTNIELYVNEPVECRWSKGPTNRPRGCKFRRPRPRSGRSALSRSYRR